MTQTLRIEPDNTEVIRFVRDTDYPNRSWVEQTWMTTQIITARVTDEYGTVGLIWGHWVSPGVLSVHAGTLPEATFEWRSILPRLLLIAHFLGADEVVMSFDNTERKDGMGRLVKRLGFIPYPDNPYEQDHLYRRKLDGRINPKTPSASEDRPSD